MKKNKRKKEIYSIDRIKKLIQSESIVLPAWQREFVWKLNQIEKIFDSIYSDYPIGNILIWETKQNSDVFYKFINNIKYIASKNSESNLNLINSSSYKKVSAILDGQQRITSIMNVLIYDNITKNNRHISLYFNVKDCTFKFFEENTSVKSNNIKKRNEPTEFDFKVKDIFDNKVRSKTMTTQYRDRINQLYKNLKNFIFSYNSYSGEFKNALEVFRRLNTGGSPLTNPEINVSIIINKAKDHNIYFRDEINRKIESLRNEYNINLNLAFFIKSIVVCILNEVKYDENKVDKEIQKILNNYKNVFDSIEKVCSYCDKVLNMSYVIKSNNVLIPLVYYYKYNTFGQGLSKAIKYYISLSLIYGYFGGQSDNVISQMVKYVDTYGTNSFDIKNLKKIEIKHVKMLANNGMISKMLEHEYREEATNVILYLIYSFISPQFVYTSNLVQDHMHPKMNFDKLKIEPNNKLYARLIKAGLTKSNINTIMKNRLWNKIPNIQLITASKNGIEGKWKKQFEDWILEDQNNRIDNTMPKYTKSSYKLKNFISFYRNRQRKLKNIIKNALS